ncbi:hypothetical protein FVEN_g3061 [Fusarium venenatum]|nr:hypothetical protein FVEN_g3061 [Fusarium venenatum]
MEQIAGQISLNDYFRPIPPPLPQRQAMQRSLPPPPPSPERQELAVSFISISSDEDEPDTRELTGPTLCREQQDLLNLIMSDENVFFTGSAGCGKSTVLKAAIAQLQAAGKKVAVTAPTGRAALNVDGITLYSYMGWNTNDVKLDLDKLKGKMYGQAKKNIRKSLKATYVLIIVEISMVENNFLSRMEAVLRDIRHIERPWGGLQLIVTGDFCQLPSVLPFQNCWGLANGSQGVIVDWEQIDMEKLPKFDGPDGDLKTTHVGLFTDEYMRNNPEPKNQVWPVVRFSNGYKKTIYPVCLVHSVNDHLGIKVFRTQIPLIPGWAITIHKSQGMTLERVIVNLKNTFEVGQAYVAHCQEQRA